MLKAVAFGVMVGALLVSGGPAQAKMDKMKKMRDRDRVAEDFQRYDTDGDGKMSPAEWNRRGNFARLDADRDGFLTLGEVRVMYEGHDDTFYDWPVDGPVPRNGGRDDSALAAKVDTEAPDRETLCAITRSRKCDGSEAEQRGLAETGLGPMFPAGAVCPGMDDYFALDYGFKRQREAKHGGIDLPAKWGTPMVAAADGTVVGVFEGADSSRGIEVNLRHSPEDTGLPFWTYTQYAHMDRLPDDLKPGDRVSKGQILGPTGNSGLSGSKKSQTTLRRPGIHFAAWYSDSPNWTERREIIVPLDGFWMEPIAFYRTTPPYDTTALKALPDAEKSTPVPVMYRDGTVEPSGSKVVWPYLCKRD